MKKNLRAFERYASAPRSIFSPQAKPRTTPASSTLKWVAKRLPTTSPLPSPSPPTGEGICNFLLPNLTIDLGGAPLPLGDIALENVSVTASGNEDTYKGETKDT